MSDELENLEQQVEEQWSALGLDLAMDAPAAVVERARSAVRRELNEAWLSGQPQPAPDAALLARVGDAMRSELARKAGRRARIVRLRRWLVSGAAAAAAVLLVVGLARLTTPPQVSSRNLLTADAEAIERFVQAADQVWSADPVSRELREELDAIEESVTSWPTGGEHDSEGFYDFNSRLDTPGGIGMREGLSVAGVRSAGVLG